MERDDEPLSAPAPARPVSEPPWRGRVLVLAPHPDDEAVGPGGALALHARLGDPLAVIFVTNGMHGDASGAEDPSAYVALRQREARASAAVLGIAEVEFWDLPDNCTVTRGDLRAVSARLVQAMERLAPDVVYAPHEGESHSDHHFVAVAAKAAAQRSARTLRLVGYEVWSPQPAQWVLDVTSVYDTKLAAVRCHASQIAHTDLVGAIEGLNAYRSILLPPDGGTSHRRAEVYRELA